MSTGNRQAPRPVGLGTHSARGLVYLFASSSAAKFISFGANIVLAYLLSRKDFGLVGLAYTITALVQVIEQAGVGDVLVRRRNFRVWAGAGFWLALAMGSVSCLLIAASAPIAATLYRQEQLLGMLLVLAPSSLTNALCVVPRAKLARELRFRALAVLNMVLVSVRMLLAIACAAVGFGAYSFVIPVPVTGVIVAAYLWWWARPPWSPRPYIRRWRFLIGDSTRLLGAEFFRALMDQCDNILLGIFRSAEIVGIYYYGFTFSVQMLQMLSVNLNNVLFPALTKLNEHPEAQYQGFLKSQRILALVGISSCLLQAAAAQPAVHLLLEPKWYPSIIVMQVLSIGMATRMVAGSSFALLKSQGRFRTILWNRLGFLVLLASSLTIVLTSGGDVRAVAITVAVVASLIGPVTLHSALRPYGAGWAEVANVLVPPAVCGVFSVGTAWTLAQGLASAGYGDIAQLVVTLVVAVALNTLSAWLWMRPVWDDLWLRVRRLVPARAAA